jgi:hypothetical protein
MMMNERKKKEIPPKYQHPETRVWKIDVGMYAGLASPSSLLQHIQHLGLEDVIY